MASIALCMIVKNEAHIIRRCLESVLPLLDYALIVDTGSTDGTQQTIRDFFSENQLPGEVLEEPWRDFAYNRSFALQKLRERSEIEYGLMIDADEVLIYANDFDVQGFKQGLVHDIYDVQTRYGAIAYQRPQIFSNHLPFCYKGVLHEYLELGEIGGRDMAKGFFNRPLQDSARSHNPQKFQHDAATLEQALDSETDPFLIARYTFYLAQSYRDCGQQQQALRAYLRRSQQGYWDEEIFVSLLNAARLKQALTYNHDEVIQSYLAAYEALPSRLEPLHDAIRFCRLHGKYQQAYMLGKHALTLCCPKVGLFLEQWIYDYGLLDEFSIVAYWAGYYQESFDACLTLLKAEKTPAEYRPRIRENAGYAIDKLGQANLNQLLPPA